MRILLFFFVTLGVKGLSGEQLENACRFNQFRCEGGSKCLSTEKLCNGVQDCPNGEDEKGNKQYDCSRITLSDKCGSDQFRCRFGGCIPESNQCDGTPNCWGGTDEAIELCQVSTRRPPPSREELKETTTKRPRTTTTTTTVQTIPSSTYPPTTRRTTTFKPKTTSYVSSTTSRYQSSEVSSLTEVNPTSNGRTHCPKLAPIEGQTISCFNSRLSQSIDCVDELSPDGTVALYTCNKYWEAALNGVSKTSRTCKKGSWKGGIKFKCFLGCGDGGHQPLAFITGSSTSLKGKWPWHVGLYESEPPGSNNYKHICGATLISQRAILTAAHCVTFYQTNEPKNIEDIQIFLGKYNRTTYNNDRDVQQISPAKIIVNPNYNYVSLSSDIAIIWLDKEADITPFIHPICLPYEDDDLEVGTQGFLAGWGSLGDRKFPEELHETTLPIVSSTTCKAKHNSLKALVSKTTFCAGYENGTSACDGDSGGGLVIKDEIYGKWFVQGIVSGGVQGTGNQGCDPNYYAVFTRVEKFKSWIDKVLDREQTLQYYL